MPAAHGIAPARPAAVSPGAAPPPPAPPPAPPAPGAPRAFAAAMTILAATVALAEFVDRPPGVAPADHALRGLVPIAVALLLALAYPRLRATARGLVALATGALAVTAGAALWPEPAAPPAAVTGAALLGLGAATLWRGRRRGGPAWRRVLRRGALTAAVAVIAGLVVLPVGIAIVVTHRPRGSAVTPDLGRPVLPVTLHTSDGLALAASYVPSRTGAAVVVFPGRRTTTAHARMLVRRGFGVLVLDRRGEGGSQGDFNARGWAGEPDLRAALDFLAARPDVRDGRIGGLGLSVGGELLLQTAAHDGRLRAVVADGAGIRSLAEQRHHPGIPAWRRPLSPFAVETLAGMVLTGHSPPPDLVRLMPRVAPRPVLLVRALAGNEDEVLNRAYRAAAPQSTQLWEVAGAAHTRALTARPAAYERRVAGFLERALNR